MSFLLQPWHIMLACLCGLLNQRQQQIMEFPNAQIETLLKKSDSFRQIHYGLHQWRNRVPFDTPKGTRVLTLRPAATRESESFDPNRGN